MAGHKIEIPGIGEVSLYKRRGMRNIRISIGANNRVRVNLPTWVPYKTGERFAIRHREWIEEQLSRKRLDLIQDGSVIGRGAVVRIESANIKRTTAKVSESSVHIRSPLEVTSNDFQKKARTACEKCLKLQAERYLPGRLEELARINGFKHENLVIKRLHSRWGSCSPQKHINLSIFLMQLPDELIDYVILHELTHTEHMNHGSDFWDRMNKALPSAKSIRKPLRHHQPHLMPINPTSKF